MTLNSHRKQHSFMAGFSAAQLTRLSLLAHEVSFSERELILLSSQQSKNSYLLLSGSVCIEAHMRA